MEQRIQQFLYQTTVVAVSLSDSGCSDNLWDSRCRRHSIGQQMHNYIYKRADAEFSPPENECRSHGY